MFEIVAKFAEYLDKITFLTYPVSLFLGFLAGMAAITCCLAIIPIIIGFIGRTGDYSKRLIIVPFFIMIGSIITLGILGFAVSVAGLTLQKLVGGYWNYVIGVTCIITGLITLKIIQLPARQLPRLKYNGFFAPVLFGMVLGGVLGFGSSCCVPVLPMVLTYAAAQGRPLHGACILSSFAIGQSIPIFAIGMFGSLLGKIANRWAVYVQKVAGILLLFIGIYLLLRGVRI